MYSKRLGQELKSARRGVGLSLREVEKRSAGYFKASALGAYERGERRISAQKLMELCHFYGHSAGELIARVERGVTRDSSPTGVCVNLQRAGELAQNTSQQQYGPFANRLFAYITEICSKRQSPPDRIVTLREEDTQALASITGLSPDAFIREATRLRILAGQG